MGYNTEILANTLRSKDVRFQHEKYLSFWEEALPGLLMTPSGHDQLYLIHSFAETHSHG